jgi:hypothetical protein
MLWIELKNGLVINAAHIVRIIPPKGCPTLNTANFKPVAVIEHLPAHYRSEATGTFPARFQPVETEISKEEWEFVRHTLQVANDRGLGMYVRFTEPLKQ